MSDETPIESEYLSKTKRKQASTAAQELGEALVKLNASQLAQLDLPENLRDAVQEAKRLTKHEAVRRQMQYIGKLMRGIDPAPIQARLDAWRGVSDQATAELHRIERWRDRLLTDDAEIAAFMTAHPGCDSQQLRTLIRNARKEKLANRPPASFRALFKFIRDTLQATNFRSENET